MNFWKSSSVPRAAVISDPKRCLRCAPPPHSKTLARPGRTVDSAKLLECGGGAQRMHRFGSEATSRIYFFKS
jgi:hypothetical protein